MQFSHLYTDRLDEELGTDDSTRLFTTARRRFGINEGLRQFADLTECYIRESTLSCSHGVGEYNLLSTSNIVSTVTGNSDFLRLSPQQPEYLLTDSGGSVVTRAVGQQMPRTTVDWLNEFQPQWRNSTGGTPQYYYERKDGGRMVIGLYPPPSTTSSRTATLRVPYVARPSSLSSDTDVPFTYSTLGTRTELEPYHQAAVHYAAYQLEKLRLQPEESARQLQVFMGYVQRYLGTKTRRGGVSVKPARNYFGEVRTRAGASGLRAWPTDLWGDR